MATTIRPRVSDDDIHVQPLYFPTVIEPFDGRCLECGKLERKATTEFSKCCDELLIDVRRYELAEIQ